MILQQQSGSCAGIASQPPWLPAPGGILGISDHIGLPENNNRDLHRMPVQRAIELAEQAGFEVQRVACWKIPEDDYKRSIFDPRLARHTDRFLLKLTKPD